MKTAIKYRYKKLLSIAAIFAMLIFTVSLVTIISPHIYKEAFNMSASFIFYASAGFCMVLGLLCNKNDFNMLLAHSLTREQIHLSVLPCLTFPVAITLFGNLMSYLTYLLAYRSSISKYSNVFESVLSVKLSQLQNVLIQMLLFVAIMSASYFLSTFLGHIGFVPKLLTAVVIILVCIIDWLPTEIQITAADAEIKTFPNFYYVPKLFFYGSVTGELFVRHFVAALVIISLASLSLAHIITLSAKLKH